MAQKIYIYVDPVANQKQFGLTFHKKLFQHFFRQSNVAIMTVKLSDNFISFTISDYCMPCNATIIFKKNA